MSLQLDFYFGSPERFPLPGFLDGLVSPQEILSKAKTALKEMLVAPDVTENHGVIKAGEVNFQGNYYIGEGSVIYGGVTILGPVYIGKNVEILQGALIRPYTIIGDNCNVGHGSELKHSVLYGGSKVASLAFVGDSVLGASARIGSGVITGNRKFDQSEVTFKFEGVKHALGSDYFGLVLGDRSRLGANCTSQPGTHIGPDTWVFPSICVRGFVPGQVRVTQEQRLNFAENPVIELKP